MDFKGAWRHSPTSVRWVLGVMFAAGIVIAVVGVFGDYHAYWDGLSFVPNLLTSLTGFMIGVPVAFFVLATVVEQREDRVEREAIDALTEQAWDEFRRDINVVFSEQLIEVLEVDTPHLVEAAIAALAKLSSVRDITTAIDVMRDAADELEIRFDHISSEILPYDSFTVWWGSIENKWQLINNQVRIRRFENKMPPIAPVIDRALIHQCASAGDVSSFYSLLGSRRDNPSAGQLYNIGELIARFRYCATEGDADYANSNVLRLSAEIKTIILKRLLHLTHSAAAYARSMREHASHDAAYTFPTPSSPVEALPGR